MSLDPHEQLEQYLSGALVRIEKAYQKILETQTYNLELEKLRILTEIIKEQLPNENSGSSARQTW